MAISVRKRSVKYFESENPILFNGEVGYEIETSKMKVGDGVNNWSQLEYEPTKPMVAWVAILNQVGTDNVTAEILDDSLSGVVLTRDGVGTTLITKIGGFPIGKTTPAKAVAYTDEITGNKIKLTPISEDVYKLETYAAVDTEVLADDVLVNQYLRIERYL